MDSHHIRHCKPSDQDYISEVATCIIHAILTTESNEKLQNIGNIVDEKYSNAWFIQRWWSRSRNPDILQLKNDYIKNNEPIKLLEATVNFFTRGNWKSTSANTVLMRELTKILPAYNCDDDKFFQDLNNTLTVKDVFLKKAQEIIENYKMLAEALPGHNSDNIKFFDDEIPTRKISSKIQELQHQLAKPTFNIDKWRETYSHSLGRPIKKVSDNSLFTQVRREMENILKQQLEVRKASGVKRK